MTISATSGRCPRVLLLTATLVGATLCVTMPSVPQGHATFPGGNGKIVFVRSSRLPEDSGLDGIYTVNPDGKELTRLTAGDRDRDPVWSPDGTSIAFGSHRAPDWGMNIWQMNADGSNLTDLSQARMPIVPVTVVSSEPTWSPDGSEIAFVGVDARLSTASESEILVMALDETQNRLLTDPEDTGYERSPDWSPTEAKIAYVSIALNQDHGQVYVVDSDGTDRTRLTEMEGFIVFDPSWSPDGSRIAFTASRAGSGEEAGLYVVDANGRSVTRLTTGQRGNCRGLRTGQRSSSLADATTPRAFL